LSRFSKQRENPLQINDYIGKILLLWDSLVFNENRVQINTINSQCHENITVYFKVSLGYKTSVNSLWSQFAFLKAADRNESFAIFLCSFTRLRRWKWTRTSFVVRRIDWQSILWFSKRWSYKPDLHIHTQILPPLGMMIKNHLLPPQLFTHLIYPDYDPKNTDFLSPNKPESFQKAAPKEWSDKGVVM
jgi:hypothetical protein